MEKGGSVLTHFVVWWSSASSSPHSWSRPCSSSQLPSGSGNWTWSPAQLPPPSPCPYLVPEDLDPTVAPMGRLTFIRVQVFVRVNHQVQGDPFDPLLRWKLSAKAVNSKNDLQTNQTRKGKSELWVRGILDCHLFHLGTKLRGPNKACHIRCQIFWFVWYILTILPI